MTRWPPGARPLMLALPLAAALLGAGLLHEVRHAKAPSFTSVSTRFQPSEGLLLARDGVPLHALRVNLHERRAAWVPLRDISPRLRTTVLAIEDHRFYQHHGVDWRALAGIAWHVARGGAPRGASTLSMQVAALLAPGARQGRRAWREKWQQMVRAWALERAWHKDQILEAYLNLASFRGELVGVGAASRLLMHKAPASLDATDALLLTLLLRSPNATALALAARGCRLLTSVPLATDCAVLTAHAGAVLNTQSRASRMARHAPQLAPHVARRLLDDSLREVRSTLDFAIQRSAAEALRRQLATLASRHVRDGAVLVLDNTTGEVLAYVGNAGRQTSAAYVDGVQAPRQAGSTLKPFLYHLALERRHLTAASLLEDSPLNLETPRGLYVPQNYDREFKGIVTVRLSLAASLNIPAVRTLMVVGPEAFLARLRALGFRHLDEDAEFYGYALALGAGEVSLWELTNAYRLLANGRFDGTQPRLQASCADAACAPPRATDSAGEDGRAAAFIVADILSDRGSRSVSFGLENPLATPFWSAVKTGTSKHMRDNWCIGFTPRHTVGVWVGNFDGSPMHEVSGMTGAAPVWAEVMRVLQRGAREPAPAAPARVVRAEVRFQDIVETARAEWFVAGTVNARVKPSALRRAPRIVYPGRDSILALDPDIPPARQRVFFTMRPLDGSLRWRVDGRDLAPATGPAWAPAAGVHTLSLVADSGRIVDEIRFAVRGAEPAPSPARDDAAW